MPLQMGIHFDRKEFMKIIADLKSKFNFTSILETGTHKGDGTSQILATTRLPVITIECNKTHYDEAVKNLSVYKNVTCLHGYSLIKKDMDEFIRKDNYQYPPDILKDSKKPVEFYSAEIKHGKLPENLLPNNILANQLIFLDSAGGVGLLEFKAVLATPIRPICLLMDDVFHVKHHRSLEQLKINHYQWGISSRWGWAQLPIYKIFL